jgi:hypothetical protein
MSAAVVADRRDGSAGTFFDLFVEIFLKSPNISPVEPPVPGDLPGSSAKFVRCFSLWIEQFRKKEGL